MKSPRFGPLILVSIFIIVLILAARFYVDRSDADGVAASLDINKFQGLVLQEKAIRSDQYLPIYGSSELSSISDYHPSKIFSNRQTGFLPFLIGRGGCESFIQFLNYAALGNSLENRKIVFIISPQWFVPEGASDYHFSKNFSPLHAYKFLFNKSLSNSLKTDGAKRLLEFEEVKSYPILAAMLRGMANENSVSKALGNVLAPLGYVQLVCLEQIDYVRSAVMIYRNQHSEVAEQKVQPDWPSVLNRAEESGRQVTSNNIYGIEDSYYNEYIAPNYQKLKDSAKSGSYIKSKEYNDLQLVLEELKQLKAEPLFVIVPVNGLWYDYTGFSKDDRQEYYAKVQTMIKNAGFKTADFSKHEYELYFLKDIMHMGWKGWVYFDEAVNDFYHRPVE